MKVISSETMQILDRRTITEAGISGAVLMENAGRCCVEQIRSGFGDGTGRRAVIIAGKGNNGGDGYVIARLLTEQGWEVDVFVLADRQQITGDAALNLERLNPEKICFATDKLPETFNDVLDGANVIIDAMLGTGLNSEISGLINDAVKAVNISGRPVVAVDIPSGLHATTGRIMGDAVRADLTVTFACAKLGHILLPGAEYVGRLVVADIGIPQELIKDTPGYEYLNAAAIQPLLHRRRRQAHKGHFGHCLIIAGSTGKTGAAALAANSAVRTGSGLVTLGVPAMLNQILEIKTTEAMTVPLPDAGYGYHGEIAFPEIERIMQNKDALAIGPGVGTNPPTKELVLKLMEKATMPLVIDADGLNIIAEDIHVLKRMKSKKVVLTPHPGEMARLMGTTVSELEATRIPAAQEFARQYGVYLILKGARTVIAAPSGEIAVNGSGNPGMASGGMGDVLTGIVISLLGQNYNPWDACRIAVFLHGFSADLVAAEKGEIGMNATDVQEKLPYAIKYLIELQ